MRQVFHDEVGAVGAKAGVIYFDNVRVAQAACHVHFVEPGLPDQILLRAVFENAGVRHFDGHFALRETVPGAIDGTAGATTDGFADVVALV